MFTAIQVKSPKSDISCKYCKRRLDKDIQMPQAKAPKIPFLGNELKRKTVQDN